MRGDKNSSSSFIIHEFLSLSGLVARARIAPRAPPGVAMSRVGSARRLSRDAVVAAARAASAAAAPAGHSAGVVRAVDATRAASSSSM